MKIKLTTSIFFLIFSFPACAVYDDATAPKQEDVVASSVINVNLTNSFEDIVNHQFDLRTQKLEEKIESNILNKIFPVGYVLITTNTNNPNSYGYIGDWQLAPDDLVLSSTTGIDLGKILGSGQNIVNVPLPAHMHTGTTSDVSLSKRFWTSTSGEHSHGGYTSSNGGHTHRITGQVGGNQGSAGPLGAVSYNLGRVGGWQTSWSGDHAHTIRTDLAGSHNHYVDITFEPHHHQLSVGSAGIANPTIDVRGARLKVLLWRRVA